MNEHEALAWAIHELTLNELCRLLGCSRPTVIKARKSTQEAYEAFLRKGKEPVKKESKTGKKPVKKRSSAGSAERPKDFEPTPATIGALGRAGVDLETILQRIENYCAAHGKTYKDWNAAVRTFCENHRGSGGQMKSSQQEKLERAMRGEL